MGCSNCIQSCCSLFFPEHLANNTPSPSPSRVPNGQPPQVSWHELSPSPSPSPSHLGGQCGGESSPFHWRNSSCAGGSVGGSVESLSRTLELFDNFLIGVHRKMVSLGWLRCWLFRVAVGVFFVQNGPAWYCLLYNLKLCVLIIIIIILLSKTLIKNGEKHKYLVKNDNSKRATYTAHAHMHMEQGMSRYVYRKQRERVRVRVKSYC